MIKNYTHKSDVIGVDKVQMKLRFADSLNDFLPTGFIIVSGQQHRPHRRKRSKNHGNNNRLLSSKPENTQLKLERVKVPSYLSNVLLSEF